LIRLPFPARHEIMWRADHVYDLCIEIGYNDDPAIPGRGSAIFLHLTADDDRPTEGCVAVSRAAMHRLLPQLRPGTRLTIA
jgi:L,D-peptidoglycan transpeptidase YkuD (ErfK/YbiS/YcfS/YnhG family)